jgi:hypothetical protein
MRSPLRPFTFVERGKDIDMARANRKRVSKSDGKSEMPAFDVAGTPRTLDARPDTPDFRDKLYEATLVEVPPYIPLEDYQQQGVPILDQGQEGACTGFGLATVANFLLRGRKVRSDKEPVSPRMFYEMARRYDEWPGEDYSGSSARGAMKGWHKHGVTSEAKWPYNPNDPAGYLDNDRAADASQRPLGAYYRVNHQDLICMHSALSEVGILYATAKVHDGWRTPNEDGAIKRTDNIIGGHAFAIVAFDHEGFWVQNSWGPDWGKGGFCHITYDDWLANGTDIWVARLGAPVAFGTAEATARGNAVIAGLGDGYTSATLRPHIISLGNDGQLETSGTYGKTTDEIHTVFDEDFPRITKDWAKKRILLYAHGGLVDEASAVQHIADYRPALLDAGIYPIGFVWHSDFGSTLRNILSDALNSRRPEGFLDTAKNFMLDRLDDALEPVARQIGGKAAWDEMRENAMLATTTSGGGARLVAEYLAKLLEEEPDIEIHLIGHSAGSIFHAPLIQLLTGAPGKKFAEGPMAGKAGLGLTIKTCTLWAPACTINLFKQAYVPAIKDELIEEFAIFTMTDQAEQDDNCAHIYNKSLLYLVSDAFEEKERIPLFRDGWPILGMEKFIRRDADLMALWKKGRADWVLSPNNDAVGTVNASRSTSHGGFDDDEATLKATFARIAGQPGGNAELVIHDSLQSLHGRRLGLETFSNPVLTALGSGDGGRAKSSATTRTPKSRRK